MKKISLKHLLIITSLGCLLGVSQHSHAADIQNDFVNVAPCHRVARASNTLSSIVKTWEADNVKLRLKKVRTPLGTITEKERKDLQPDAQKRLEVVQQARHFAELVAVHKQASLDIAKGLNRVEAVDSARRSLSPQAVKFARDVLDQQASSEEFNAFFPFELYAQASRTGIKQSLAAYDPFGLNSYSLEQRKFILEQQAWTLRHLRVLANTSDYGWELSFDSDCRYKIGEIMNTLDLSKDQAQALLFGHDPNYNAKARDAFIGAVYSTREIEEAQRQRAEREAREDAEREARIREMESLTEKEEERPKELNHEEKMQQRMELMEAQAQQYYSSTPTNL